MSELVDNGAGANERIATTNAQARCVRYCVGLSDPIWPRLLVRLAPDGGRPCWQSHWDLSALDGWARLWPVDSWTPATRSRSSTPTKTLWPVSSNVGLFAGAPQPTLLRLPRRSSSAFPPPRSSAPLRFRRRESSLVLA